MKLNRKRIDQLSIAAIALLVITLLGLDLAKVIDIDIFYPSVCGAVLILVLADVLKKKVDPEGARIESEARALAEASKQTVRVRPSIAGCACDLVTVCVLVAAWTLAYRHGVINNNEMGFPVTAAFTLLSIIYLVMSYLPKTIGGTTGVTGMKQVKQLVVRSHALAVTSALLVLCNVILYIQPQRLVNEAAAFILVALFLGLFLWRYFFKHGAAVQDKIKEIEQAKQQRQ